MDAAEIFTSHGGEIGNQAAAEIAGNAGSRQLRQRLYFGNTFSKKDDPQRSCLA
jgi:hypothetical protein